MKLEQGQRNIPLYNLRLEKKKRAPTAHYLRKCKLLLCQISLKPSPAPLFTASNRGIYLYCVAPDVCLLKLIHMSLGKVWVYQMDN